MCYSHEYKVIFYLSMKTNSTFKQSMKMSLKNYKYVVSQPIRNA